MRNHVTVVPSDGVIIVDGYGFRLDFPSPANVHAIQWHEGAGHIEYVNNSVPNKEISGLADYTVHVASFVDAWEKEKAREEEEANRLPSLEEARATKLLQINAQTSAAILAGFTYTINGQSLHFSYEANDQQNFSDTANAATLAKMGVSGVPQGVTWNGWKVTVDNKGKETGRSLVRLKLTPDDFLTFYMQGALHHKAAQMESGGQRKALAEKAATLEALEAI